MKKLGQHQIRHFARMTAEERKSAINDFERQISVIAASNSPAADEKRAELQARIDHLLKLNTRARK